MRAPPQTTLDVSSASLGGINGLLRAVSPQHPKQPVLDPSSLSPRGRARAGSAVVVSGTGDMQLVPDKSESRCSKPWPRSILLTDDRVPVACIVRKLFLAFRFASANAARKSRDALMTPKDPEPPGSRPSSTCGHLRTRRRVTLFRCPLRLSDESGSVFRWSLQTSLEWLRAL